MTKAENTRIEILKKAFNLIYQNGYQATSIDDILASTPVTKGAFYWHFKNKEEMGIALITDVMHKEIWPLVTKTLSKSPDFRKNLYGMMKGLLFEHPVLTVEHGCPAVNLIHEMAPLNLQFRKALKNSLTEWENAVTDEFKRAQQRGELSADHNIKQSALYIITLYHGVRSMGKVLGKDYYKSFLKEFKQYLSSLQ